jgi:hypothetical protein
MASNDSLRELQAWYKAQCNEDWEHSYGVKIETLDNPGWTLTIDLRETDLQDKPFQTRSHGVIADNLTKSEDWMVCKVEEQRFKGAGGPNKLEELIATFIEWAKSNA